LCILFEIENSNSDSKVNSIGNRKQKIKKINKNKKETAPPGPDLASLGPFLFSHLRRPIYFIPRQPTFLQPLTGGPPWQDFPSAWTCLPVPLPCGATLSAPPSTSEQNHIQSLTHATNSTASCASSSKRTPNCPWPPL
jgi:hypothetical protein